MLCEKCSNISFTHLKARDGDRTSWFLYKHHVNQQKLYESKDLCRLCAKMWFALRKEWETCHSSKLEKAKPAPITMGLELTTTRLTDKKIYGAIAGELLYVECEHLAKVYADYDWSCESDDTLKTNIRDETVSEPGQDRIWEDRKTPFDGGLFYTKYWLKTCSERHLLCQQANKPSDLPFRILQILGPDKVRLLTGKKMKALYVCLSYKWGDAAKYTLTSNALPEFEQGLETDQMPRTFRESVKLAFELEFEYLWIDAVCILQDDPAELNQQIGIMDKIFRGSALTFFAAAGNDVHAGMGTVRSFVLVRPAAVDFTIQYNSAVWLRQFYIGTFYGQSYGHESNPAPLFDRGWVLQEEVLSQRALVFNSDQLTWACGTEHASEKTPGALSVQYEVKYHSSGLQLENFRVWLSGRDPCTDDKRWPKTHERHDLYDEWYRIICNYSKRTLSYHCDVLPAVAGLASAMSEKWAKTYLAGLWAEDIQLGLLWYTVSSSQATTRAPAPSLPSWSWTSHFGTGRTIDFQHKRRYVRDKASGLQLLDSKFTMPIGLSNPFGEVTSGIITIRACVKWTSVVCKPGKAEAEATACIQTDSLVDSGQDKVASFLADDPERAYNRYGMVHVLCVLCAVAPYQVDQANMSNTETTAICVIPSGDGSGRRYRRVGLALFEYKYSDWFGRRQWDPQTDTYFWDTSDGAYMATLEII